MPSSEGAPAGSEPAHDAGPPARGGLFLQLETTDELAAATSDQAWLRAMLDFEAALALAEADVGVIPLQAAGEIGARCLQGSFEADELGRAALAGSNPVIPLVKALRELLPSEAAQWVHWGATSQDVLDSAAMLVARRSCEIVLRELAAAADACAALAERHKDTLEVGRTLLQHALPLTFGLKAAGWLVALLEARERLGEVVEARLAVQLGGAAGTLAALGTHGPQVAHRVAGRLGLAEAPLPWHTNRTRIAELASALGVVAGVAGKIALDVALLSQTEVSEVSEAGVPGRGGSSTLPHKRNPVGAVEVGAASRRALGLVQVALFAMLAEHERAAGAWQSEWLTLTELLRAAGGAVARLAQLLEGLEVDPARMVANLDLTRGLVMAEAVTLRLARKAGRERAEELVGSASRRVLSLGTRLSDELRDDPEIASQLDPGELEGLLEPGGYLGATALFVDRALEAHRQASGDRGEGTGQRTWR
ncbi:MAG: 3-carboxy-cis,cis-muconate cycloisomerase [Acidimicrobiales bacterium]